MENCSEKVQGGDREITNDVKMKNGKITHISQVKIQFNVHSTQSYVS